MLTETFPKLAEAFQRIAREQYGFITDQDAEVIRAHVPSPTMKVLVRCGRSRFLCPLNKLEERMAQVERDGDYVRDVSIPHSPLPTDWITLGYQPPKV
jgi:hypothetical protein